MKTTTYRFAGTTLKAQFKTVGQGWEVCVHTGTKCLFVGNFIHKGEATRWWTTMNKEIRTFGRKYWIGNKSATTWYATFFSNHLYKTYYKFLDKLFVKYNKTYTRSVTQNVRKYNTLRRGWTGRGQTRMTIKAA